MLGYVDSPEGSNILAFVASAGQIEQPMVAAGSEATVEVDASYQHPEVQVPIPLTPKRNSQHLDGFVAAFNNLIANSHDECAPMGFDYDAFVECNQNECYHEPIRPVTPSSNSRETNSQGS